jgi:hypothetical protein
VLIGDVSYPQGAASEYTNLFGLNHPSLLSLFVNSPTERIGPLDGSSIAGRAFIAYREVVWYGRKGGKYLYAVYPAPESGRESWSRTVSQKGDE